MYCIYSEISGHDRYTETWKFTHILPFPFWDELYNNDQVIEGFVRGKTACLFKDPDLDTEHILQCWSPNSYRLWFFFWSIFSGSCISFGPLAPLTYSHFKACLVFSFSPSFTSLRMWLKIHLWDTCLRSTEGLCRLFIRFLLPHNRGW